MQVTASFEVQEFAPEDLLGPLNTAESKFAPKALYVIGDEALLRSGRRVSVVGTRAASPDETKRVRKLVRSLVSHGVTVVSGLAAGIDTVAHSTAIELGGRTVAVLGTPADRAYPSANRDLHQTIASAHCVVSQFPAGSPTRRGNFPMRNKTMALLSDATVIVAVGETSGTAHQGWEALRLGRDLLVLESLANRGYAWTDKLRRYGAGVLSDKNLEIWLDSLPERIVLDDAALAF
ncbi:MAG: DNA-processing protein DprA [Bryobacterales bacterium]|nr:DNA-processing protein DprA [Bryobacterales bacterium]